MRVSLIVAVADGGVIGRDNRLPWRLPDDLRRFRSLTTGHHIIMGRRTHESIGRPLPGRTNLVLTGHPERVWPGCRAVADLEEALGVAREAGETECFVIGGARVYETAWPLAERLYLTRVNGTFEGDVFLPDPDLAGWTLTDREAHPADPAHPVPFEFLVYDRTAPSRP